MLHRALIVDDSLPLHQLIKTHLADEGLEFHSGYDGEAGVAKSVEFRPSVILLDVDMPDMDGFEVCRRLKANAETNAIPVIFLTADSQTCDKVKGLELGAFDYVTKPFKSDELCARVRAALRFHNLVEQKSMIDGLTGLRNKRFLEDHLAAQLSLANRTGQPLSCIAIDVDGLQTINQNHGVAFADGLLRTLGKIFLNQSRAEDAVCHCSGGKFAILAAGMSRTAAGLLADRLCDQVRRQLIHRKGRDIGLTCSFGVADTQVGGDVPLMARAEAALTRAKQNGGNCVSIARPARKEMRVAA